MTAHFPLTSDAQKKADSRRKRKAILAGGVVLGLGAAVTLAAWSDDVFASGTFNTGGNFALQGAIDPLSTEMANKSWAPYGTSDTAAELAFAASMAPGETVYAPFSIQTTTPTDLTGTLTQVSASTDGGILTPFLSYTIGQGATACEAGGSNGTQWATAATVTSTATNATLAGLAPAVSEGATDQVELCIAVTLADSQDSRNAINGATDTVETTIIWDFLGTQDS